MSFLQRLGNGSFWTLLYEKTIKKTRVMSTSDVFQLQDKLLEQILEYVVHHCKYYKEVMYGKKIELRNFPIMDKSTIKSRPNDFNADCRDRYAYSVATTGGSTGEPFSFYMHGGYEYEFGLKKWKLYGFSSGDTIVAMDGTKVSDEKIQKAEYWGKKNSDPIPFGNTFMSSLYLTEKNAYSYCEYLAKLKPTFMRGYPSFIYEIACYMEKYEFASEKWMKGVELTSETITEQQIQKISEVFGCPVYLQYGHTEGCVFAYTYDETYRYRCEPLYGYVEVLDENGNHVNDGEIGEVAVTTLYNHATPLIRYRTGDFAEYGGKDKQFVYLNKVYGRTQDYIVNKDGDKVLLTALIFGQHNAAMKNILRWQIEQNEVGKIILHIIKAGKYTTQDEEELRKQFENLGNVDVIFDYTETIQRTGRGKSKMIIQNII